MAHGYRWKKEDQNALAELRRLWPELQIRVGHNNALARFESIKALQKFLQFLAQDEDILPRMRPYTPGSPAPTPPRWAYMLVETEPLTFVAEVSIPPKDLRLIVSTLRSKE